MASRPCDPPQDQSRAPVYLSRPPALPLARGSVTGTASNARASQQRQAPRPIPVRLSCPSPRGRWLECKPTQERVCAAGPESHHHLCHRSWPVPRCGLACLSPGGSKSKEGDAVLITSMVGGSSHHRRRPRPQPHTPRRVCVGWRGGPLCCPAASWPGFCMGHRSRCRIDRVLSACKVRGTRKVVNYTMPRRSRGKLRWRSVAVLTCKLCSLSMA